jgi:pimeloyl-ACP methyl ester carboxylesterase
MNSSPLPHTLYLRVGDEWVFATHHPPADAPSSTAVLICPPFGWEEVCSYRPRREWAADLAQQGYATLRIDLPGTGDSGGAPVDPLRLDAWSDAVRASATWLRDSASARSIAAIGIGLGGLVLCKAVAAGAPVDEAVLWGTPSRGRTLVRELRAFARMERAQVSVDDESELPTPDSAGVEAGGFALSEETTGALEALDLTALPLSAAPMHRALLLRRDGIEADSRLRSHLEENGVQVTLADGAGYSAMTDEPQQARPPTETFARVAAWLQESRTGDPDATGAPDVDGAPGVDGAPNATDNPNATGAAGPAETTRDGPLGVGHTTRIELTIDGARISETAMYVEQPFGRLFGILAQPLQGPPAGLGAVLLNAGAIRRIGPNRMWVDIARRWAGRGVPTLRLDVEGIGDADGDAARFSDVAELYVPELVEQVRAAVDALERDGIAARFVLAGLCSGAYWSFHAALQDPRVSAALMLNPQVLFWDSSQETVRELRKAFLRRSSWSRALRGGSSLARAQALLRELPAGIAVLARRRLSGQRMAAPADDALQDALRRLADTRKRALFVFSGEEPLYEELDRGGAIERLERWPLVELVRIPGHDHTLRPPAARRGVCEALDRGLELELERTANAPAARGATGAELR